MEAGSATAAPGGGLRRTRRLYDRIGDRVLYGLTALAGLATLALIAAIIWKLIQGAWPSIKHFGFSFLWTSSWDPVHNQFGALQFILGTVITSFGALLIAGPLSIAIGLFLSELAPPSIRGPIGTLVDMLAAIPSVVIGLWGIYVLSPPIAHTVEPFLHKWLGWIPLVGKLFGTPTESSVFTAILVLTIMMVPITSAVCRELFLAVPRDLKEERSPSARRDWRWCGASPSSTLAAASSAR